MYTNYSLRHLDGHRLLFALSLLILTHASSMAQSEGQQPANAAPAEGGILAKKPVFQLPMEQTDKDPKPSQVPVQFRDLKAKLTLTTPKKDGQPPFPLVPGIKSVPAIEVDLTSMMNESGYVERPIASINANDFRVYYLENFNGTGVSQGENSPFTQGNRWQSELKSLTFEIVESEADSKQSAKVVLRLQFPESWISTTLYPEGYKFYVAYIGHKTNGDAEAQVHGVYVNDKVNTHLQIWEVQSLSAPAGATMPVQKLAKKTSPPFRQPIKFVDLSPVMTEGLEFRRQRKVPAIRVIIPKDNVSDVEKALDEWEKQAIKDVSASPFRLFRLYSLTNNDRDQDEEKLFSDKTISDKSVLFELPVRSVERNLQVSGEYFIFFGKSKSEIVPTTSSTTTSQPSGDAKRVAKGDPIYVVFTGSDLAKPALVHGKEKEVEKGGEKKKVVALARVDYAPAKFETTRLEKELLVSAAEVELVPKSDAVRFAGVSSIPSVVPTPPLTPTDRLPTTLAGLTDREKINVRRIRIPGLEFNGTLPSPFRSFGSGTIRLSGLISENSRDPDSRIELQFIATHGLLVGRGYGQRYSALHPRDEGIFYAPQLDVVTTQRIFGGESRDNQLQIIFAPLRFRASTQGAKTGLFGSQNARDTSEELNRPHTFFAVNASLEGDYYQYKRTVPGVLTAGGSGSNLSLNDSGFQGPYLTLEATWRIPNLLGLPWAKGDDKQKADSKGIAFEATGYYRKFFNDRNGVVRDAIRRTNNGILPFDLPSFPDQASDYQLSLEVPLDLGLLNGSSKRFRIGYRNGFPKSQSFYDIFSQNSTRFFIETDL